jgi:hypothetical protein
MSLALNYDRLRREIGRHLGWGRDADSWEPDEQSDCDDIIASGLARFYYPKPAEGQSQHLWTFLRRVADVSLSADVRSYDLPADFGGSATDMTFADGTKKQPATQVSEEHIRAVYSRSVATGTPKYFAVRVRSEVGTPGTAYELLVSPIPDTTYSVQVRYAITPQTLSSSNPHPLGGPQHSQTIIEACLAAAEETLGDTEGIHANRFAALLAISISLDQQQFPAAEGSWDIGEHVDPSLGLTRGYLKRLAGNQLEYGPNPASWTHRQEQEINTALNTGLRKFYSPMVLPGERTPYEWSFLRPIAQLTLVEDQYRYDLPADFSMLLGPFLYAPGQNTLYQPIVIVGEHQVRQRLARDETSNRPTMAAIVAKTPDAGTGTRWEVLFNCGADDEYVLSFRYQCDPHQVAADETLPYGGVPHSQTLIEAVLSVCEEQAGKRGIHSQLFIEQLVRSIGHDRRTASPDTLGYNSDCSDLMPLDYGDHHGRGSYVTTYNGQTWDR